MFLWYFANFRTVVRTVCGQFCCIFAESRIVVRTVCGQLSTCCLLLW